MLFRSHMGSDRVTIQNVRIIQINADRNMILLEGSIPGAEGAPVRIEKSKKRAGVIKAPKLFEVTVEEEGGEAAKKAKAKK